MNPTNIELEKAGINLVEPHTKFKLLKSTYVDGAVVYTSDDGFVRLTAQHNKKDPVTIEEAFIDYDSLGKIMGNRKRWEKKLKAVRTDKKGSSKEKIERFVVE